MTKPGRQLHRHSSRRDVTARQCASLSLQWRRQDGNWLRESVLRRLHEVQTPKTPETPPTRVSSGPSTVIGETRVQQSDDAQLEDEASSDGSRTSAVIDEESTLSGDDVLVAAETVDDGAGNATGHSRKICLLQWRQIG